MRKLILHFKFLPFILHLGSKFQRYILFSLVPPPRSWCTHFWVQTGDQTSHLLSDMHERLFLLQCCKFVPPRKRVMGSSVSQLPAHPHSSISCNITSLPSMRCHSNEKWKKQYSATAGGSIREEILKQESVLETPAITGSSPARAIKTLQCCLLFNATTCAQK